MAVAKHKVSKTRKRLRRSHNALEAAVTTKCPQCGEVIRPHRVCKLAEITKVKKFLQVKKKLNQRSKTEILIIFVLFFLFIDISSYFC